MPANQVQPDRTKLTVGTNFTKNNILVFSDWEGGVPIKPPATPTNNDISQYLEYTNNKLLTLKTPKDTAMIFLGDLIDNAEHGIRLMTSMLQLKKTLGQELLLIGGNRDFNKIRFADEMCISMNGFPCVYKQAYGTEPHGTFQEAVNALIKKIKLVKRTFTADKLVQGYQVKPWHVNNYDLYTRPLDTESIERVLLDMYTVDVEKAKSMDHVFNELVALKIILKPEEPANADKDTKKKYEADLLIYKRMAVTLFNMLASRKWDEKDLITDIKVNENSLNGLYVSYLEQCKVCELFEFNSKYGFASHGGLSPMESTYTSVLGASYELTKLKEDLLDVKGTQRVNFESASLQEVISKYHTALLKPVLATLVGSKDTVPLTRDNNPQLLHLIHTTAATKFGTENQLMFHHSLSPIVGYHPPARGKKLTVGGHYGNRAYMNTKDDQVVSYASFEKPDGTQITWNIYGHQPRGLFPAVHKEATTYHICLDVSKIEGQTNKNSYAAMILTKEDTTTKIFGCVPSFKDVSVNTDVYSFTGATWGNNGSILSKPLVYNDTLDAFIKKTKYDDPITYKYDVTNVHPTDVSIPLVSSVNIELQKVQAYKSVQDKDNYTYYMYHSDFMGTSPSPIIYNKIFMIDNKNMTGHKENSSGASSQKFIGPTNVFVMHPKPQPSPPTAGGGIRKPTNKLAKLKEYAKRMKIKGSSRMSEKELISALKSAIKKPQKQKSVLVIE